MNSKVSSLEQIKSEINSIINRDRSSGKPIVTSIDRKILAIEQDLNEEQFQQTGQISLGLILDESTPFGETGFLAKDYSLSWEPLNNGQFTFYLENRIHHHKKRLINCPSQFKELTFPLLEVFISKIIGHLRPN